MQIRLYIPNTKNEIVVSDVSKHERMFVGKVSHLCCSGELLALFRHLEMMANDNIIPEAERITLQIDRFGFVAQWPNRPEPLPISRLQIMNGDDVAFEADFPRETELK
ncbi:MAG: hypothetical protein K1X67_05700 [Fimbriimonadaceae bacterium]|nr:hypothetical protein [Fimbriimonadaceae bacterium]